MPKKNPKYHHKFKTSMPLDKFLKGEIKVADQKIKKSSSLVSKEKQKSS